MKTSSKKALRKTSMRTSSKASRKSAVRNVKTTKRPGSRRMASAFVNSSGLN